MGTLYLVRHGQASFGSADYDRLSPLGVQQAQALGAHFRAAGLQPARVFTGTLRRHAQTLEGIAHGMGQALTPSVLPAWDEYDPQALVQAVRPQGLSAPDTPLAVREHFRALREGLLAWMGGATAPVGMPTHSAFRARIAGALEEARASPEADVLVVSSGGPISLAVGLVLGLAAEAVVDLNLRLRNSAVTEFVASPRRHSLLSFNTLPHLQGAGQRDWITYA